MGKKPRQIRQTPNHHAKSMQRDKISHIRSKLKAFLEEEYKAKKPLEIRLIKLKAQISFKKGSMLPNLLVKSLQGANYIIYLDFGNEVRFYFYDSNGTNMGASTFSKNKKILDEMKGKGQTLYVLPKRGPANKDFDNPSIQLNERYHKFYQRMAKSNALSKRDLLPLSVKEVKTTSSSIRIGISVDKTQNKKAILHFDKKFYNSPERDIILLREIFIQEMDITEGNIPLQLIGTFWALLKTKLVNYQLYLNHIKPMEPSIDINDRKFISWIPSIIKEVFLNKHEYIKTFSKFLLQTSKILVKYNDPILFKIFLIWMLKKGIHTHIAFLKIKNIAIQESWLIYTLIHTVYEGEVSKQVHMIDTTQFWEDPKNWYLYLMAHFILEYSKDYSPSEEIPFQFSHRIISVNWDDQHSIFKLLKENKLAEFTSIVMKCEIEEKNTRFLFENHIIKLISTLFSTTGISVTISPQLCNEIEINSPTEYSVLLENHTDLPLNSPQVIFRGEPSKRLLIRVITKDNQTVFDKKLNFDIKITGNAMGNAHLILEFNHSIGKSLQIFSNKISIETIRNFVLIQKEISII